MNKLTGLDEVHKELLEYHRLKRKWGLGPIKVMLSRCQMKYCEDRPKRILHENMRKKHTIVMGGHLDRNNILRWNFLGTNIKAAHARLDYTTFSFLELLELVTP